MAHKQREPRLPISVSARLNFGSDWSDVHIRNVSSKGLMALAKCPPKRGEYVEIRKGHLVIIGRVAWAGEDRFGVASRDVIDAGALQNPGPVPKKPDGDRRRAARVSEKYGSKRKPDFAVAAEASRQLGRAVDFTFMAASAALICVMLANLAYEALSRPLDEVQQALAPGNQAHASERQLDR